MAPHLLCKGDAFGAVQGAVPLPFLLFLMPMSLPKGPPVTLNFETGRFGGLLRTTQNGTLTSDVVLLLSSLVRRG